VSELTIYTWRKKFGEIEVMNEVNRKCVSGACAATTSRLKRSNPCDVVVPF
jgi:hypothetical protein